MCCGSGTGTFDADGMHLVSVGLSAAEVRDYYQLQLVPGMLRAR